MAVFSLWTLVEILRVQKKGKLLLLDLYLKYDDGAEVYWHRVN